MTIGMRIILGIVCLVLVAFNAEAQFKNILIDSAKSNTGRYPCEPSITINYKNPNNMVAGSAIDNVYYSFDGGVTWEKSRIRSPHGVWGDPVLISDFSNNLYYFHLSDPKGTNWQSDEVLDRIVVQKSKDGGKTWDAGESIGHNPPKDQDKEWATTDRKGNLYVSWTQFDKYGSDDPTCESVILFSKSSNGSRWSKPVPISLIKGDCKDDDNTTQGAVPAVSNDGKVFITWSNQSTIYMDRSFDGGNTWLTSDIAIVTQEGGWNLKIPGFDRSNGMPVLICDNTKSTASGALYLVWSDQTNGEDNTDIWLMRSFNFGDNWTQPILINTDSTITHQFLPSVTLDPVTGYLYILYYDRSNYEDEQTDVYLAYSIDHGGTFKNVKISERPFKPQADVFFGDYLNISAYKGRIAPIWTRMDNGKTSIWTAIINHEELEKIK